MSPRIRALILLLLMCAASSIIVSAGAKSPQAPAKPTTKIIVALSGATLASPFDGLKPNRLFSVRNVLNHRREPSGCSPRDGTENLK